MKLKDYGRQLLSNGIGLFLFFARNCSFLFGFYRPVNEFCSHLFWATGAFGIESSSNIVGAFTTKIFLLLFLLSCRGVLLWVVLFLVERFFIVLDTGNSFLYISISLLSVLEDSKL